MTYKQVQRMKLGQPPVTSHHEKLGRVTSHYPQLLRAASTSLRQWRQGSYPIHDWQPSDIQSPNRPPRSGQSRPRYSPSY
jgi:hypothetical protein